MVLVQLKPEAVQIGLCCSLLVTFLSPALAATLAPLPANFAKEVKNGWLPELCIRPDNPQAPRSLLRLWAQPRNGKPVRVLFICGSQHQYEAIAIARTFDLQCDIIPLWYGYSWRENNLDPDTMNLLRYYLGARRYNVVAMTSAALSVLPVDCQKRIAELVEEQGVGMVYALPGLMIRVPEMRAKPSPTLDPLLPLKMDTSGYKSKSRGVAFAASHPLNQGVVFSRIQWHVDTDVEAVPGATVLLRNERKDRVLAAAVTRGKGRIVAYNRCLAENIAGYHFLPMIEFEGDDEQRLGKCCRWLGALESSQQFYNWLGRALLWAGGADAPVKIHSTAVGVSGQQVKVQICSTADKAQPVRLKGIVRSPFDTVQAAFEVEGNILPDCTTTMSCPLPSTGRLGEHLLDLWLITEYGRVIDWSSSTFNIITAFRVEIEPDFARHAPTDEVRTRLQIAGLAVGQPFTVHTELFDLDGRLLVNQEHQEKALDGKTAVVEVIRLAPTLISSRLANLRVTVTANGESVEVHDQLSVRQTPRWDQFHVMAYDSCDHNLLCCNVLIDVLKKSGHDTIGFSFPNPFRARTATETGLRCVAGHVSSSCSYDPQRLGKMVGWLKTFSPVLYEQEDEPELQMTPAAEARFDGPTDMERFCGRLKAKYKTIDALNRAWGTQYGKWEDVRRWLWQEVLDRDNWTPWFDSRHDLDCSFAQRYERCSRTIREIEPDAFCPINPRTIETFSGVDLRHLTRRLQASSLYNHFVARPPMGYLELGAQWVDVGQSVGGYSWPSNPNPAGLAHEAWDSVRHGVKHLAWFAPFCDETPPQGRFSYVAGDYTLNHKGRAIAKINGKLSAGPGDVAVNTAPVDEGIFIYYPRTLFYAHTLAFMQRQLNKNPSLDPVKMTGIGPWMEMLPNSFVPAMHALGYQFQFGDEEDLTAARLRKTRVVVLSHVICLGPRELGLLRDFVKSGGCVVAEAGTGRRDAEGRLYSETPDVFRAVFGVERPTPCTSPIVGRDGVAPCGAKRLDVVPPQVGVIYQNGSAFFLDCVLPANATGTTLVQSILNLAGVKPTYALCENVFRDGIVASVFARRLGNLTWLYVLGESDSKHRCSIELSQPQYIYEMTSDVDLGASRVVEATLAYGDARVFALAPSRIVGVGAESLRREYRPGDVVEINYTVSTQDAESGERLLRVECRGPRNALPLVVPRVLRMKQGKAELRFFLPLDLTDGIIEVVARDLSSGETCRTELNVTK